MPSLDPPVPIRASFQAAFTLGLVEFDKPLVLGDFDPANWRLRWMNQDRPVTSARVLVGSPTVVTIRTTGVAGDIGPDTIDYTPPPADIISNTARQIPAPGFINFPLVTGP